MVFAGIAELYLAWMPESRVQLRRSGGNRLPLAGCQPALNFPSLGPPAASRLLISQAWDRRLLVGQVHVFSPILIQLSLASSSKIVTYPQHDHRRIPPLQNA